MTDPLTLAALSPPADVLAERAVLGGILLDPALMAVVREQLRPEDFHHPAHAVIYAAMMALAARGAAIDIVTMAAELRERERLNTVGGAQYLGELTDEMPTTAHIASHVAIVADLAARRRAIEELRTQAARLHTGATVEAVRERIGTALADTRRAAAGAVSADVPALVDRYWARKRGEERPIRTPWPNVDAVLGGGLWPGMYVVVGGTGAGKTQWAVQVATEAAVAGLSGLYLALELSRLDICARVAGTLARVPWSGVLRGTLNDQQASQLSEALKRMDGLPLHTECGVPFGYGPELLSARAASQRPALVVLDYLQLCGGRPGEDVRATVGRVSYVARTIARDLGAVVLVLSSTARANYADLVNDPAKDPSDLVGLGKESGEIEYAADGVLVLSRDKAEATRRTLVVAKNRHGPLGRVELEWSGTEFSEPRGDMPTRSDLAAVEF